MEKYRTPNYDMIQYESECFCYSCKAQFGMFGRRTRCRLCNHAFCLECCKPSLSIPGQKDTTMYLGIKYFTFETDKFKVCKSCIQRVFNMVKVEKLIDFFAMNSFLDMKDFCKMSLANKNWYQACRFFIQRFHQIKHYHPNHPYDKIDRQILVNNAFLMKKSLDYQIHLYRCIGKDALCYLKCREISKPLEHYQILNLIPLPLPKELFNFVLFWLKKFDKVSLQCSLPFLVFHLEKNSFMVDFLVEECNDTSFAFDFYVLTERYLQVNQTFWNEVRCKISKKNPNILKTHHFLKQMLKASGKDSNELSFSLVNMLKENLDSKVNIWLPFNDNITDFMLSDISVSDSATSPIVLPYKNKNNEINSLLLKHDDVYKDLVVMNCIQLIDLILKKELEIDFGIITYKVIPFLRDGIIQMVNKSHTMYEIKEKLQFTIQNFIIEKNKNESIDSIRTRFMKSCSAYCVITYLFGIGDRHFENIMISDDGKLFHIDYGYILGSDPKILNSEMKITPEMIDCLGGSHSEYYQNFKKYCNDIYNVLRKYTNLFIHLFSVLDEDKLKITEQIIQRFMPGQEERHATLQLYSNMEKSVRSINIEDFLRYHSKNKTVSKLFRFWK